MAEYTPITILPYFSVEVASDSMWAKYSYRRYTRLNTTNRIHMKCAEPDVGLTYTLRYELGNLSGNLVENEMANTGTLSELWRLSSANDDHAALLDGVDYCLGTLYCDTYNGEELIGTTLMYFTLIGEDITGLSGGNAPPSDIALGASSTLVLDATDTTFAHNLSYKMDEYAGNIAENAEGSASWTAPYELANNLPESTEGYIDITCETVRSTSGAVIGSAVFKIPIKVPDNTDTKPTVSIKTSPVSELPDTFDGLFIKGLTGVKVELTAEGKYSAGITGHTAKVEGITSEENPAEFGAVSVSGELTVTCTATDTRGYTGTATEKLFVYAYDKPSVVPMDGEVKVVCVRCLKDGTVNQKGEYVLIKAGRKYSAIESGGVNLNSCTLRYRYKAATAGEYSDWITLLAPDVEDDYVSVVPNDLVLPVKTAYTFQIGVVDTVGRYGNITLQVSAATTTFHQGLGGRNVAVGQYCDYSHADAFDIGFTTYFNTGIAKRVIFENGTWAAGEELSAVVEDSDVTSVGLYTVFIALCGGVPVICVRIGSVICGSGLRMNYEEVDGVGQLTLQEAIDSVMSLYALL